MLKRRLAVVLIGPLLIVSGGVPSLGVHSPATIGLSPTPCTGQTVAPGATATYSITITNNGPTATATPIDLTLADTDGANFTSSVHDSGGSPITQVALDADASITVDLRVTASASAPYVASNTTTFTATRSDDPTVTSSLNCVTTVAEGAAVAMTKTVDDTTPSVGQQITYEIGWVNPGPQTVPGFVVTDTVDTDLTFLSAGGGGVYDSGTRTITWTIGNLNPPVTGTVTFTASVDEVPDQTVIGNTAFGDGTNVAAGSASRSVTVQGPNMSVAKSVSASTARPGDRLTYTIGFRNTGAQDLTNAEITDAIDSSLTVDTSTITPPGSLSGGVITWSMGTIAAGGATQTVSFEATVDVVPDGTSVTNSATVDGDAMAPVTSNLVSTTINSEADLSVTKTVAPSPATAGQQVVFDIVVTNNGPNDNAGFVVSDTLPSEFGSITAPGCTVVSRTVTCSSSGLTDGSSQTFTVNATPSPSVPHGTVVTNTATVSTTSTTDPSSGNNSGSVAVTIVASADLVLSKTDSPDPVVAGTNLTYTVVVTNAGPSDNTGSTVADVLPSGTSFVSASSGCSVLGPVVTCTSAGLAAGSSVTYTVTVLVSSAVPDGTSIANTATISTNATSDPDPSNDSDTAATSVAARADLRIVKLDSPDPVEPVQQLTYSIAVTNLGSSDNTGFTVEDQIPVGTSFVSATVGDCSESGGLVTCTSAGLAFGQTVTWTVVVSVDAGTPNGDVLSNTASIETTSTTDPNSSNDASTVTTTVSAPTLGVTKTASPSSGSDVSPGQAISFTMIVDNSGSASATGLVVTDTVHALLGSVVPDSGGVFDPATRVITWNLPDLAPGATTTVGFTTRVGSASSSQSISNRAQTIAVQLADPVLSNTTSHNLRLPDVVISKDADRTEGSEVKAFDSITYTLRIENRNSRGSAFGVIVTDVLPSHLNYVSGSTTLDGSSIPDVGGTSPVLGSGVSLGTMLPRAVRTITFRVSVDVAAPAGSLLENWSYVNWTANAGSAIGDFHRLRVFRPTVGPTLRQSILVQGPSGTTVFITVFNQVLGRAFGILPVTGAGAALISILALSGIGAGGSLLVRRRPVRRDERR